MWGKLVQPWSFKFKSCAPLGETSDWAPSPFIVPLYPYLFLTPGFEKYSLGVFVTDNLLMARVSFSYSFKGSHLLTEQI